MPSPFPGMDPYLEGSAWESFHAAMIDEMGRQLAPRLRPKYLVRVERRFVAGVTRPAEEIGVAASTAGDAYPDVAVLHRQGGPRPAAATTVAGQAALLEPPLQLATVITARVPQRSLAIRDAAERRLVAAIELLSPSNKRVGGGREEYLQRRDHFLASEAHLIELDLLRRGSRLPMHGALPPAPFFAFVSRADRRPLTGPLTGIWPIRLDERLPAIPVPLRADDGEIPLDLQAALTGTYDAYGFDLELDYTRPPEVPLPPAEAAWARERVANVIRPDPQGPRSNS